MHATLPGPPYHKLMRAPVCYRSGGGADAGADGCGGGSGGYGGGGKRLICEGPCSPPPGPWLPRLRARACACMRACICSVPIVCAQ